MIAVVDASAATKLFLPEAGSEVVRDVWPSVELSGPTILLAELAAAVRRGIRHPDARDVTADAVDVVRRSGRWREVDEGLALRAAALAARTAVRGMDAIYLAMALEIAERYLRVVLLSFDTRQRAAALDLGIAVIPAVLPTT